MNRSQAKGTRFEHRVKHDMEERGWFVMRSPASKSPIDLLAVSQSEVAFLQCKTDGRLDPEPWNALYELANHYGALPILAAKPVKGGVAYYLLTGPKRTDAANRWAPMDPWTPSDVRRDSE